MTIQELYTKIGGDYNQAVKVMRSDKLIDRYIRKLKNSNLDEMLAAAAESMDSTALFESAHGMKGVCANLGLMELAHEAETITEEFRIGNPRKMTDDEIKAKLQSIVERYRKTVEGIAQYEAEA